MSTHTLDGYRRDLGKVRAFCIQASATGPGWTHATCAGWSPACISRACFAAAARLLSATRGLYLNICCVAELCRHDPATGLSPQNASATFPAPWTPAAARNCSTAQSRTTSSAAAIKACSTLFYSSGLRLSELVGLDLDGLDLARRSGTRAAKATRCANWSAAAVRHWNTGCHRSPQPAFNDGAVFVSQQGRRLGPCAACACARPAC